MAIDLNGSTGISLDDNEKINIGNDSDLQIYHDGTESFIDEAGTGGLYIRANDRVEIHKYTGEVMIGAVADGEVTLYHNNAAKLATTSTGIDVTGTVTSDGLTVDGSSTLDDIKLTSVALPSSGNPSIALRNTDNNIYIQTGSGNALSLLDSSQNTMYNVSSTIHSFNISNSEKMRIDSSGAVTMPAQPAFSATKSAKQSNVATNSQVTVVFETEVFDQNNDFAGSQFTAPVTGKYQLNLSLYTNELDSAADYYIAAIQTSNRQYQNVIDPGVLASDPVYWNQGISVLADMDANDTAYVFIQQGNGNQQADVATPSFFTGYLVA